MIRRRWGTAWLFAAMIFAGPAMSRSIEDLHVDLRARAGLPPASAVGEVTIFRQALYLGGSSSTVARRNTRGRWTVSRVETLGRAPNGVRAKNWTLSRDSAEVLERWLDDPALYQMTGSVGKQSCLDPGMLVAEVAWKGRSTSLEADCEADDALKALSGILNAS